MRCELCNCIDQWEFIGGIREPEGDPIGSSESGLDLVQMETPTITLVKIDLGAKQRDLGHWNLVSHCLNDGDHALGISEGPSNSPNATDCRLR